MLGYPTKNQNRRRISKTIKKERSFTYLRIPLTVAGETVEEISDILNTYTELLQQILACPLSLALKIEALRHVAMATIEHHTTLLILKKI